MIFDGVIGHDDIKKQLENAVLNNRVSHAYIFAGKRGVGKTTVANAFADAVTNGSKVDVTVVTNEKYDTQSKSDAVSVKAVRGASADMYVKPYSADKRVFIIPDAEKMTIQAQNALLKVFEEPPSYCVIILITQNDNMLLQTIRSRAVTIRFGMLSDSVIESFVKEQGMEKSSVITRLASGSIGMAKTFLQDSELPVVLDRFVKMFGEIGKGTAVVIYELIAYFKSEKKNSEILFDIMLVMLRDTMLNKNSDLAISGISSKKAVRIIETVENTRNSFSFNANYDLAVSEMMLDILGEVND